MAASDVTRREFLRTAAIAGAAGAAVPLPAAEVPPPAPRGRPRVGCLSWCFHGFEGGTSPEEAIDIIGEIGFDGIELIVLAPEDLERLWTDQAVDRLRRKLERNRLRVSQFVLFQPVVAGLSSLDAEERRKSLDNFAAGCRIGKRIGAPIVNIVAPWAREYDPRGRLGYLPRHYEMKEPKPGEKFRIEIAPGFDWARIWDAWVETVKACVERAKAEGLKFTIEHHTHCLVPDADAFLRLRDAVRDPDLGYNMDLGWTLCQREYPPLAIHKVKGHLMNVHARDIDGLFRTFVHAGEGVMDFRAVADALKATGFDGFVSLEQDKHPGDMKETCRKYLELMREALA